MYYFLIDGRKGIFQIWNSYIQGIVINTSRKSTGDKLSNLILFFANDVPKVQSANNRPRLFSFLWLYIQIRMLQYKSGSYLCPLKYHSSCYALFQKDAYQITFLLSHSSHLPLDRKANGYIVFYIIWKRIIFSNIKIRVYG